MISIYVRPHEWSPELADIPFLQIFMGLTLLGLAADLAQRRTHFAPIATSGTAALFMVWSFLTLLTRDPSRAADRAWLLFLPFLIFALVAQAIQTPSALRKVAFTLFGAGLFVACFGVVQGAGDDRCFVFDPRAPEGSRPYSDGRPCSVDEERTRREAGEACYAGGRPGVDYRCEKAGPFMTSTIEGRTRYLGVLADPNELALATSIAVPFAFAFFELRRSLSRLLLLLGTAAVVAVGVVETGSRGGQLVFATVLGAYFVRRYGRLWGAVTAGALSAPLALYGGRSGEGADQSALDRLEAAGAGLKMLAAYPVRGVGYGQFAEHHWLTAHNAYVLSAGELGIPGLYLFSALLYLSAKITLATLQHPFPDGDPEAHALRSLAMALLAAFAGIAVGIFFLSWTFHFVLWLHLGLAGALHGVMRHRYPSFEVRLSMIERGGIVLFWLLLLPLYAFHIRRSGCW